MTEDRLSLAFGRLERAIARLETQLPLPPTPPAPPSGVAPDADTVLRAQFSNLEDRHATLRQAAAATVARLDRLLDTAREG